MQSALAAVALTGLMLAAVSTAQPPPPKKTEKKVSPYYDAKFKSAPHDWTTQYYPHDVVVHYETDQDGQYVRVQNGGNNKDDVPAKKYSGDVTFELTYNGDTTNEEISSRIHPKGGMDWPNDHTRVGLTFLDPGGPMGVKLNIRDYLKSEHGARKNAAPGGALQVGLHSGVFPPSTKPADLLGAQARMLVKAQFTVGSLRTDYDLPANILWVTLENKVYAIWYVYLPKSYEAGHFKPDDTTSEKGVTVVHVELLAGDGKVLRLMAYHP